MQGSITNQNRRQSFWQTHAKVSHLFNEALQI